MRNKSSRAIYIPPPPAAPNETKAGNGFGLIYRHDAATPGCQWLEMRCSPAGNKFQAQQADAAPAEFFRAFENLFPK